MGELVVTETKPHSPNRALVASFLFTDLVGFSKGTTAEQYAAKAALAATLRGNLAALRDVDYHIKDTGDGALIAFVSNPEHALYMALAIAEDFGRAAGAAGFPSNSLRTGVHLGSVKEQMDMEARPNFIGDGINAAKRIMDFAAPGQITASRAFFDAVGSLDSAYAALFSHVGAPDDKHGRAHELYAISPSATVLERFKRDLAVEAQASTAFAAKSQSSAKPNKKSATAPTTDPGVESSQTGRVRKWFFPVTAVVALSILVVFVGTKLTEPSGPKIPQVATEPVSVQTPSNPAVAPIDAAGDVPVVTQPSASIPPRPEGSEAVPGPHVMEGTPEVARPASIPAAAATKTNPNARPRSIVPPSIALPASTAPEGSSPRCSRIMEKATLGEALSTDEKRELANSCR
jgi:class 3 adenylate cyclase